MSNTFQPPCNVENFIIACQFGLINLVKDFIKQNVNINAKNYFGQTPLMLAIQNGNIDIAQYLLQQKGIDIHAKTNIEQKTALHFAAEKGYSIIVTALLQLGAKHYEVDVYGRTALMYAAKNKFFSTIVALNKYQPTTVNYQDKDGKTALMHALENQVPNKVVVQFLVNNGANLNLKDRFGKTIYEYASSEDLREMGLTE